MAASHLTPETARAFLVGSLGSVREKGIALTNWVPFVFGWTQDGPQKRAPRARGLPFAQALSGCSQGADSPSRLPRCAAFCKANSPKCLNRLIPPWDF